jgi:hypothetical protein
LHRISTCEHGKRRERGKSIERGNGKTGKKGKGGEGGREGRWKLQAEVRQAREAR